MNDVVTAIEPVAPDSTVIDTTTEAPASGGGVPRTLETEDKTPSLRDTVAAEVKKDAEEKPEVDPKVEDKPVKDAEKPKDEKAEEKPKTEARERGTDGKFAAKPKEGEEQVSEVAKPDAEAEKAQAQYPTPPKNFLPDSREKWANVPRSVRRDIETMDREHTAFREQAVEANRRYNEIKPFDEMARSNGRDLRESLQKMSDIESAMQRDPVVGLNQILSEVGPRKADGSPVTIYELAQHVMEQGPQGYHDRMTRAQAAQPQQEDPRIAQMQQGFADMQERMIEATIIAPFKVEHPRYDELHDTIASLLEGGMIPASLSAEQRLEAAYVYAERLVPPSTQSAETVELPATGRVDTSNGTKSIRSAPGEVSGDMEPESGKSIRELLEDETKRSRRSG